MSIALLSAYGIADMIKIPSLFEQKGKVSHRQMLVLQKMLTCEWTPQRITTDSLTVERMKFLWCSYTCIHQAQKYIECIISYLNSLFLIQLGRKRVDIKWAIEITGQLNATRWNCSI